MNFHSTGLLLFYADLESVLTRRHLLDIHLYFACISRRHSIVPMHMESSSSLPLGWIVGNAVTVRAWFLLTDYFCDTLLMMTCVLSPVSLSLFLLQDLKKVLSFPPYPGEFLHPVVYACTAVMLLCLFASIITYIVHHR